LPGSLSSNYGARLRLRSRYVAPPAARTSRTSGTTQTGSACAEPLAPATGPSEGTAEAGPEAVPASLGDSLTSSLMGSAGVDGAGSEADGTVVALAGLSVAPGVAVPGSGAADGVAVGAGGLPAVVADGWLDGVFDGALDGWLDGLVDGFLVGAAEVGAVVGAALGVGALAWGVGLTAGALFAPLCQAKAT